MYRTTLYVYYIGHMYTNIDISQRLRQSGILEKGEYDIIVIIYEVANLTSQLLVNCSNLFLMQNLK